MKNNENDEKIKELLSDPSSEKLGILLLAQTMGDPKRDYDLLSYAHYDKAIVLFAVVYGTPIIRASSEWITIGANLKKLKVMTLKEFTTHFSKNTFRSNISNKAVVFYELGPELYSEKDMLAVKPPACLAHLFV